MLLIVPESQRAIIPHDFLNLYRLIFAFNEEQRRQKLKNLDINKECPAGGYQVSRGLLLIAGCLEKDGHTVEYLQLDCLKDKFSTGLENYVNEKMKKAEIIGVTCYTPNYPEAVCITQQAKNVNPNVVTVLGGPHVTFADIEAIKEPTVDIIVRGEGEQTFSELAGMIDKKGLQGITKIRGITLKDKNKIIRNPDRSPPPISNLPQPAYHLLKCDSAKQQFTVVVETLRGCPFRCLFCVESRLMKKIRFRQIEDVIEEISFISGTFGYNMLHICDSIFPIHRKHVLRFCDLVQKEGFDMFFNCNVRPKYLDSKLMKTMRKTGFVEFFLGIESASNHILRLMQKPATFQEYTRFCRLAKKYIPAITTSWMVGYPGETYNTAKESEIGLRHLLRNDLITDAWPRVFVPYPGTPPFEQPYKYGVRILTKEWRRYVKFAFPPVFDSFKLGRFHTWKFFISMVATTNQILGQKLGINKKEIDEINSEAIKDPLEYKKIALSFLRKLKRSKS